MTKKKSFGGAVEFKSNPKFEKERESRHKEGLKLIEKWLKRYPKTKYPTVDDDLILLFVQGARLLDLNYMILPEDEMECPECGKIRPVEGFDKGMCSCCSQVQIVELDEHGSIINTW